MLEWMLLAGKWLTAGKVLLFSEIVDTMKKIMRVSRHDAHNQMSLLKKNHTA